VDRASLQGPGVWVWSHRCKVSVSGCGCAWRLRCARTPGKHGALPSLNHGAEKLEVKQAGGQCMPCREEGQVLWCGRVQCLLWGVPVVVEERDAVQAGFGGRAGCCKCHKPLPLLSRQACARDHLRACIHTNSRTSACMHLCMHIRHTCVTINTNFYTHTHTHTHTLTHTIANLHTQVSQVIGRGFSSVLGSGTGILGALEVGALARLSPYGASNKESSNFRLSWQIIPKQKTCTTKTWLSL